MKKIFLLTVIPSFVALIGCGDGKETKVENENPIPAGWVELDLTQPNTTYGLPLLINVPDEATAQGIAEIMESPLGGTQVKAGKNFNLEIFPGDGNMAAKKQEIEGNLVFKSTYIIDEPDFILYTSEIEDAGIKQYHFYAIIKLGTSSYEIEDIKGEDYTETGIKKMMEAAKSLRAKPQV